MNPQWSGVSVLDMLTYCTVMNLWYTVFIAVYCIYLVLFVLPEALLGWLEANEHQPIKSIWTAYWYVFCQLWFDIFFWYDITCSTFLKLIAINAFRVKHHLPPWFLVQAEHGRDFGVWTLGGFQHRISQRNLPKLEPLGTLTAQQFGMLKRNLKQKL